MAMVVIAATRCLHVPYVLEKAYDKNAVARRKSLMWCLFPQQATTKDKVKSAGVFARTEFFSIFFLYAFRYFCFGNTV